MEAVKLENVIFLIKITKLALTYLTYTHTYTYIYISNIDISLINSNFQKYLEKFINTHNIFIIYSPFSKYK